MPLNRAVGAGELSFPGSGQVKRVRGERGGADSDCQHGERAQGAATPPGPAASKARIYRGLILHDLLLLAVHVFSALQAATAARRGKVCRPRTARKRRAIDAGGSM